MGETQTAMDRGTRAPAVGHLFLIYHPGTGELSTQRSLHLSCGRGRKGGEWACESERRMAVSSSNAALFRESNARLVDFVCYDCNE